MDQLKEKTILLLGGSAQQIVAIETARRLGYRTVLCDYLPDNPGQHHADRFYLVSTTDQEAVLHVAEQERAAGVLAYASDPAAPTAAYVAEKLGLPGNPYASVRILCNKDLFRAFLKEHGFCTPEAQGYSDVKTACQDIQSGRFRLPVIVKPVDSSGSKGVGRIDTPSEAREKLEAAMQFSRSGRIIVEAYVEKLGYQVAGDGLSIDGQLVFRCFANDHFDASGANPYVPVSASFPYHQPPEVHEKIHREIQRLLTLLQMKSSAYNFDIRVDSDLHVYLMEVAPRDGGNYIPQVIEHLTGVNLVEYAVRLAMGERVASPAMLQPQGFASYFAVHSRFDGVLDRIEIPDAIRKNHVIAECSLAQPGTQVKAFTGANTALGCLLMKFDSMDQMLDMMDHPDHWIRVVLKEKADARSLEREDLDGLQ